MVTNTNLHIIVEHIEAQNNKSEKQLWFINYMEMFNKYFNIHN